MKNILFVTPTTTFDNGAEISIFYLMKYLVSHGYNIYSVCQEIPAPQQDEHQKHYDEAGIKMIYLPAAKWWWEDAPGGKPGSKAHRVESYRRNIKEIGEIIEEHFIELVISNTVNVFQGALAAKLAGIPHYWLIHEFPEKEFAYYLDKCDFISEYSTEIFSVSGNLNNCLQQLFKNKKIGSFVPYTQIPDMDLSKGDKVRIVSVGRVNERKNQLELIKSFERLQTKEHSDLELVFIGPWDDDYKKEFQSYIDKRKLKNISFLGFKSNPWEYLTDKDICVFTSAQETFGLVYVEAILKGLPTILSDNLGHKTAYDIFGIGSMYHLGDIDELTDMIKSMLDNQETIYSQSSQDKEKAKKLYSVETTYKEIIEQIKNQKPLSTKCSLRHISDLITVNTEPTKLERGARKVSHFLYKVKQKLKKASI
ncbi:glycosyltransferase family 4 protein [Streptococcus sp. FT1-106]|uniref:glycosyltransferase family 4 protein n=1 Tax=Streptococcus sp. FT1-106 TaxID=3409994 RepID=UPI003BF50675